LYDASRIGQRQSRRRLSSSTVTSKKSYDFVIIGAGSAGCVMTKRLSESGASISLLESGKSDIGYWDSFKIQMPAALTFNLKDNKYNWFYKTAVQKHCGNRRMDCPRGKVLGGSSSLNAMVYIRGHPLDYERWEKQQGQQGWGYADVLPYFQKASSHELGGDDYRGSDGPLKVHRVRNTWTELYHCFVDAGVQAGYGYTDDLNGHRQEGFGPMDMTINWENGVRWNTANAYLRPALKESSKIEITSQAHVRRIIFEGKKAVGVEFDRKDSGSTSIVYGDEIILCGGTINSPQVLQLSGIGPREVLQGLGIPIIEELPVGEGLEDHLELYLQYKIKKERLKEVNTLYEIGSWRYPHKNIWAGLEWMTKGTGMVSSNHLEAGGFIRSKAGIEHPDIQYHFLPGALHGQADFLPYPAMQIHAGTMRALSRGHVRIQSKDPYAHPEIDFNYLSEYEDVEDLIRTVKLTGELFTMDALKELRGDPLNTSKHIEDHTDAELENFVRNNVESAYHPSCTCAMGKVTDNEGRVYGVEHLRVVDASIMPSVVSGNLNAPTIMMAEKIADVIKGVPSLTPSKASYFQHPDWKRRQR